MKHTTIYIDFDNIYSALLNPNSVYYRFLPSTDDANLRLLYSFIMMQDEWMEHLEQQICSLLQKDTTEEYTINKRNMYYNPSKFNIYEQRFMCGGNNLKSCPQYSKYGKTGADGTIYVDMLKEADNSPPDVVVLLTSDSDFIPLINRMRELGKTLLLLPISHANKTLFQVSQRLDASLFIKTLYNLSITVHQDTIDSFTLADIETSASYSTNNWLFDDHNKR